MKKKSKDRRTSEAKITIACDIFRIEPPTGCSFTVNGIKHKVDESVHVKVTDKVEISNEPQSFTVTTNHYEKSSRDIRVARRSEGTALVNEILKGRDDRQANRFKGMAQNIEEVKPVNIPGYKLRG